MSLINNMLQGLEKVPTKAMLVEEDSNSISFRVTSFFISNKLYMMILFSLMCFASTVYLFKNGFIENNDNHFVIGVKKQSSVDIKEAVLEDAPLNLEKKKDELKVVEPIAVQEPIAAFKSKKIKPAVIPVAEKKSAPDNDEMVGDLSRVLATSYVHMNRIEDAIKILLENPPELKNDPEHYALLAALYQKTAQHQKAIDIYWRLIDQYPNGGKWWAGLAISLEATGETQEALESYRHAKLHKDLSAPLSKYVAERIKVLKPYS